MWLEGKHQLNLWIFHRSLREARLSTKRYDDKGWKQKGIIMQD